MYKNYLCVIKIPRSIPLIDFASILFSFDFRSTGNLQASKSGSWVTFSSSLPLLPQGMNPHEIRGALENFEVVYFPEAELF